MKFPLRIVSPETLKFELQDLDNSKNILEKDGRKTFDSITIMNPFSEVEHARWFKLGTVAWKIAEGIGKGRGGLGDEEKKSKLGALHADALIWGSRGYDNYLHDQDMYWRGTKPLLEIAKRNARVFPGSEMSQVPIGNAVRGKI